MSDYPQANYDTPTKRCENCDGKGHHPNTSECCGASMNDDIGVCLGCKEHSDCASCEVCGGIGIVDISEEEQAMDKECRRTDIL